MNEAAQRMDRRDPVEQVAELLGQAPEHEAETPAQDALPEIEDAPETGEEIEAGEQQAEQGEILDLASLAAAIGVDESWLYTLKVPMPDGRDPITMGEWKDSVTQLERDRKALEKRQADLHQAEQRAQQALSMVGGIPQEVQDALAEVKAIEAQYSRINWDEFEEKSAGQAALLRQKLNDAHAAAVSRFQQSQQRAQAIQMQLVAQRRNEETQRLIDKVPEWRDPQVALRDRDQMFTTFQSRYGIGADELMAVNDHRYVLAMRDLAQLLSKQEQTDAAMHKVVAAPRTLKPIGNATTRHKASEKKVSDLLVRAKSGSIEDKQAAVASLLSLKGIT